MPRKHRLLLVGVGFFLACLIAEGGLRFYRAFRMEPPPVAADLISLLTPEVQSPSQKQGLFMPDPGLIYRHRPGGRMVWRRVEHQVNAQGWRGPDWPKVEEDDTVLLCLGDSITFGLGVPFEETFCERVKPFLTPDSPRVPIVLNAGVGGYNVQQKVRLFEALLPIWKPDIVILDFYRDDLVPFFLGVDGRGRLIWNPESFRPPLAEFQVFPTVLKRHSLLLKFVEQRVRMLLHTSLLQIPWASRWSREGMAWQEAERNLDRLVRLARPFHVQVVLAYFPNSLDFRHRIFRLDPDFLRLRRIARKLKIPLVDMREVFRSHLEEGLYLEGDLVHLNRRGHELAAGALAKAMGPLLRRPVKE